MVIFFLLFRQSLQEDLNLALQDLSDDPITITSWFVTRNGIQTSYSSIIQECNQNLLKFTPYPNNYQKTYELPHLEFDEITIEMDVYFIHFSQSFLRIKIDQKIIFQQTFSTDNLSQNNVCGGLDSQYTIKQKFYSSNNQINLDIFYTALSPDSYIGIRNLNIYTNGYKLSNRCPMESPYLQDINCVQYCDYPNSYLGGEDMLVCQTDSNEQSSLIGNYETTQDGIWQFSNLNPPIEQQQYLDNNNYLLKKNIYNNIMQSALFSSALTCYSQCYYITQNIEDSYILQITFVLYIFGDWNDGSYLGMYISGEPLFQNNMVRIFKTQGEYYCTTGSKFYFSNVTKTQGGITKARRTLITFQGKFYSSSVKIGFSQQIYGSGSYGFGNIYVYQSYEDPKIVLSGIYGIPYKCITDYYAYNGYCVQNCPPHSYQDNVNNNCTDLQQQQSVIFDTNYQQSNRLGSYIVKDFYDNNFDQNLIKQIFQIIPPTFNNYQNGQPFSFIGNKKILGGFNSWGYGSYGIQIDLPIHNQVRIYFKLYLIDDWQNGDSFKYVIDSGISQTYTMNNPDQQLQGLSTYDQQIYVQQVISHTQRQLKLIFHCQIQSKNSSVASCGISDLFILYDQYVDVYCNQTNLYFSYFTNNCEICDGSDCFLYPTNYYANGLSDKALFGCQQRDQAKLNECYTCSAPQYQIQPLDGTCECVSNFIIQDYECTPCHYSCDTCSGLSQNDCLTCDPTRYFVGQTCQCNPNYYDVYSVQPCSLIYNYESQLCEYTCQTCFALKHFHCVTCPDNSFRTLNQQNSCVCDQQYLDTGQPVCSKIICDRSCLTCKGVFSSDCLSCQNNFRLDNGYCICDGQFNNVVSSDICYQNDSNCNETSCKGQSLQGYLNCDPNSYRCLKIVSSQQQQCVCFDGYYDESGTCIECDQNCLTCQDTETTCLTCDLTKNRQLNINQCDCAVGYNDKLAPGQACVLNYNGCHYSCNECFGPSNNQCLTCKEFRQLKDFTCPCIPSKYENVNNQSCDPCNYTCLTCNGYQQNNCLSCDIQLFRELLLDQCICKQGYFEMQGVCNQCHYSCLSCTSSGSSNCIDCDNLNFRLIINFECNCIDGYADTGNKICQSINYQKLVCPNECNNCDSQLKCKSCKFSNNILTINGRCDCISGYQKDSDGLCIDCQSNQGKALIQCQYQNAQDGVWTYGEKCDDGNNDSRDGCDNFQITPNYSCVNIFNQPSICYKCPENCIKCKLEQDEIICISCDQNYYNAISECIKCFEESCLECIKPSYCSVCKNQKTPFNGQCNLCEYGYYYDGQQCSSQCGDGIKTIDELCDDSNLLSNDGCSENCQIEDDFVCQVINNQSGCFINEQPYLMMTVPYQKSSEIKQLMITVSQDVAYQDVQIILKQSSLIKVQFYISGNNTLIIDLKLTFQQSYEQITLDLTIEGTILNKYNQTLQSNQLQIILTDIFVLDNEQKQQSEQISKIGQSVVISATGLSVTSLLMGGTSSFIQLLNLISQLQYIQYINISIPQNLIDFLNLFNGFTISPVFQLAQIDLTYEQPSQEVFAYNEINAYYLANIKGFLLALITSFILYLLCKVLINLLQDFKLNQLKRGNLTIYSYNRCNKIIIFLTKFSKKVKQQTLTQLILTSCYDVQFAIFMQINNPYMDNADQILNLIFAYITFIYLCYFMFNKIYDEEIKNGSQQNIYNQIKLFQSQVFTFAIVYLQDFPQSQIIIISISSLLVSFYIFQVQPFKNNFNNHRLTIQESILFVFIITFIAYVYFPSEIDPVLLGWFHITNIMLIILGSLVIDIYQYVIIIRNFY